MKLLSRGLLPTVLLLSGAFCSAQADGIYTISTISQWNGDTISAWGATQVPNDAAIATFGQTFQATATDSLLSSMMFEISTWGNSAINYQAYVYAWNGGITGPALFTSGVKTITPSPNFQAVMISTGAVQLTPGQEYIAFFSTIGETNGTSAYAAWGLTSNGAYTGGQFVTDGFASFSDLSNGYWNAYNDDSAFALQFVPEPATFFLLGCGLVALGLITKRKTHRRTVG